MYILCRLRSPIIICGKVIIFTIVCANWTQKTCKLITVKTELKTVDPLKKKLLPVIWPKKKENLTTIRVHIVAIYDINFNVLPL